MEVTSRTIELVLRGATVAGKTILIFVLAKAVSTDQLAQYGLFTATLALALLLVGFDYYNFTIRELLRPANANSTIIIIRQFQFSIIALLVTAPVLILALLLQNPFPSVALFFFPLLVTELLAQESWRILIALGQTTRAAVVLFLRSGVWCFAFLLAHFFSEVEIKLTAVMLAWLTGGIAALVVGAKGLTAKLSWRDVVRTKPKFDWFIKGIRVSIAFLVATALWRFLFTADRYWIDFYSGPDALAAYVVYISVFAGCLAFLDAGVVVRVYPRLVASYLKNDGAEIKRARAEMLKGLSLGILILYPVSLLGIEILVRWLDSPVYREHKDIIYPLLVALALYVISLPAHYHLYAKQRDKWIVWVTVVATLIALAIWQILIPDAGPSGAAVGLVGACTILAVAKWALSLTMHDQ